MAGIAPIVLLLAGVNVSTLIQRAEVAQAKITSGTVTISSSQTIDGTVTKSRYTYSFQGKRLLLHIDQTDKATGHTDRTYLFNDKKAIAYDKAANEYVNRDVSGQASLTKAIHEVLGQVDDPLNLYLNPKFPKAFLSPFESLSGWNVHQVQGGYVAERSATEQHKKSRTVLGFTGGGLLKRFEIDSPDGSIHWDIQYRPTTGSLTFSLPSHARRVSAFTYINVTPVYRDAKAKRITETLLRRFANFRTGIITITSAGVKTELVLGDGKFRQTGPGYKWTYDGKTLAILDTVKRRLYRGNLKSSRVVETLTATGFPADSIARNLLQDKVPFTEFLGPQVHVRNPGSIGKGNKVVDILELKSENHLVSVLVPRSSGLPSQVATDITDFTGNSLSHTERNFIYSPDTGRTTNRFTLSPPTGVQLFGLPRPRHSQ